MESSQKDRMSDTIRPVLNTRPIQTRGRMSGQGDLVLLLQAIQHSHHTLMSWQLMHYLMMQQKDVSVIHMRHLTFRPWQLNEHDHTDNERFWNGFWINQTVWNQYQVIVLHVTIGPDDKFFRHAAVVVIDLSGRTILILDPANINDYVPRASSGEDHLKRIICQTLPWLADEDKQDFRVLHPRLAVQDIDFGDRFLNRPSRWHCYRFASEYIDQVILGQQTVDRFLEDCQGDQQEEITLHWIRHWVLDPMLEHFPALALFLLITQVIRARVDLTQHLQMLIGNPQSAQALAQNLIRIRDWGQMNDLTQGEIFQELSNIDKQGQARQWLDEVRPLWDALILPRFAGRNVHQPATKDALFQGLIDFHADRFHARDIDWVIIRPGESSQAGPSPDIVYRVDMWRKRLADAIQNGGTWPNLSASIKMYRMVNDSFRIADAIEQDDFVPSLPFPPHEESATAISPVVPTFLPPSATQSILGTRLPELISVPRRVKPRLKPKKSAPATQQQLSWAKKYDLSAIDVPVPIF